MDKLIFIVGVGRSGTSLLQSMLSSHSNINFTPESHFIKNYMSSDLKIRRLQKKGVKNLERLFRNDINILKSNIDINSLLRKYNKSKKLELSEVFENFQKIHLKITQKKIGGEKDARNIDYLDIIKKYFPKSKIILICRDPRDVVLSKSKANWSSKRPMWLHSFIGSSQFTLGLKKATDLFGANLFLIKYEDLISQPVIELSKICKFLDLKYEKKMLLFNETAKTLFVKKEEMQYKHNNFKPLLKNNCNKWKNELSNKTIWFIQSTNYEMMKMMNYKVVEFEDSKLIYYLLTPILNLFSRFFNLTYSLYLRLISLF